MLHVNRAAFRKPDGRRHLVGHMGFYLEKVLIFHGFRTDERHIIGRGVMVFIEKAGRICEMTVDAAERDCGLIHKIGKRFAGAGDIAGQSISCFIRGFQKHRVQEILDGKCVTLLQLGVR